MLTSKKKTPMSRDELNPPIESKPPRRPLSRLEFGLLIFLLVSGFALRAWRISSVGLDHFDEGVYVFSALGLMDTSQPHRLYPGQERFSPPVYFSLVGLFYRTIGRPSDTAPFLINAILGTLTILAVWYIGRAWFSVQAGLAAAVLLAFNEYHIALCRTALTDVAFGLFFLLALGAIVTAMKRQSVYLSVIAGLAIGLAWNTKYHGWLALPIAGVALLPLASFGRRRGIFSLRNFVLLGIMAIVALVCYFPWAMFIQSQPGGYVAFSKYQSTLISFRWLRNLWWHARMQLFLEGPLNRASILAAFLGISFLYSRKKWASTKSILIIAFLSILTLALGGSGAAAVLALLAVPLLLKKRPLFPAWLVISWLAILGFITPFYHPYARLVLPFTIATFLAAGYWVSAMIPEEQTGGDSAPKQKILAVGIVLIATLISFVIPDASNPWRSSRSVSKAALEMRSIIPPGGRTIVIGEPALAFYIHLANRPAFERIEDMAILGSLAEPVYVVTGRYASMREIRDGLKKLGDRLMYLGTFPMDPKDIRLLDDLAPREARRFRAQPDETFSLKVYRLLPKR
jgi:dolichyl-phosphate-mannose-protein mannosyltransferase